MGLIQPARAALLALALLWFLTATAAAHGAALVTYVTLDPALPQPGEAAAVRMQVVDAYNNPVPNLEIQAALGAADSAGGVAVELVRQDEGTFSGSLIFPSAGQWRLRLEARAAGEPYAGELLIRVGEGAVPVRDVGLELEHVEAPAALRFPWGWTMVLAVLAVPIAVAFAALWRRRPAGGGQ